MKQAIPSIRLICSALFVVSAGCGGASPDDSQGTGKLSDDSVIERADSQSPDDESADLADAGPPDDEIVEEAGDEELSNDRAAGKALDDGDPVAPPVPCPKFLDANKKYTAGWTYTTDALGRAHTAQAGHLKINTRARTPCETIVGNWGGAEFDGSHLIASTLDGISRRYNLVPFPKVANLGPMKVFENLAKVCMTTDPTLNPQVDNYTVVAVYNKNNKGVIPDRVKMSMDYVRRVHNTQVRDTISVDIKNSTSASYMTQLKNQIRKQGTDVGCRN